MVSNACRVWKPDETLVFEILLKNLYNIAWRGAQSNSVYVSLLKIRIVLVDCGSKSLRQNFFSRERPLLPRGKILYFATIMDTNRDSAHQSQNEDNFPTFPWVRVLKWGRKRGKTTETVKPSKLQTGLFQPSKVSLNVSVLKLLNMKLELSTENLK